MRTPEGQALYRRFRAARGEERRRLLGELLVANRPLVKVLVSQVCGISHESVPDIGRRRRRTRKQPILYGADKVPWEMLENAGLEGMAVALERLDPAKGKISAYARWRILHSIQSMLKTEPFVRTPTGSESERPQVALIDDYEPLERYLEHDCSTPTSTTLEGLTPEIVAEWQASGDWPETIEEARERIAERTLPRLIISTPRDPVTCFLEARCTARPHYRVSVWEMWNRYQNDARAGGWEPGTRQRFVARVLTRPGVSTKTVRAEWAETPRAGFAGLRLV